MSQNNRLWAIGSVTVMIAVLLAAWFLGAQPALASAASAELERQNVQAQNDAQLLELARLAELREDQSEIEDTYEELRRAIPATADTSAFIDGLDVLAVRAGVTITGLTVGDPLAYTVPQSAVVVTPDPDADPAAEPAAEPVPAPVTPSGPVAVTSPLITPDNFVGVLIGVDVAGSYSAVLDFIDGLQSDTRLFLVTGITSDRDADAGDANVVAARVSGFIYVLDQR
jgi:hypothetical protein